MTNYGDRSCRGPNSAVPTRTHVEPCLTAISKSFDMPADKPTAFGCDSSTRRVLRLQPVKGLLGVPVQRRDAHQPDQFQASRLLDLQRKPRSTAPGVVDVDAAARHVAVETDLDVDPQRVLAAGRRPAPPPPPDRARPPTASCRSSARYAPTGPATGPCCAESGRPYASACPASRPAGKRLTTGRVRLPSAEASCSRDSPTDRQPNRDKIATSVAGKNLVIGSSSISPTLRPAASAAAASRDRTAANACVNSDSRSALIRRRRPPPSRSFHPDQRRQPPGWRTPAMAEQGRVGHRAARIDIDRRDTQIA